MEKWNPSTRTLRTADPERLVEGLRGSDLQPCQLSRSPATSELARIQLPGSCLDLVRLGPDMLFSGSMPREFYSLVYVTECPEPGRVFDFGVEHTEGYLGLFTPGRTLDFTTPEGYGNLSLTLPGADLLASMDRRHAGIPDSLLTGGAVMRVGPGQQRVLGALNSVLREMLADSTQPLENGAVLRETERGLHAAFLDALIDGGEHPVSPVGRHITRRHARLRKARDYFAAHAHEPVYLKDLCEVTGLGQRSLEILFRDLLGVSPIVYLHHHRLHGARRALQRASPESGAVKKIALEWGFWHFGHFSTDYVAFFGENPSATLAS